MKLGLKPVTIALALTMAALAAHALPPPEKVTWLGLTSRETPPVVGAQLDLPKGTGLVVDLVIPDSPAAKAGVQANDVLTKLDDQILINPPQLAVLVRNKAAGDMVQLTLLRKGKPQTVAITLGENDAPPAPGFGAITIQPGNPLPPGFVPMKPGHGGAGNAWVMPNMPGASVMVQSASGDENSSMSVAQFSDGEHSITLQTRDGKRTVSIADRAGKVLFTGPYDTDVEKAKVPAELAEKIKQMEENQKHVPQEMFAPPALPPGPM